MYVLGLGSNIGDRLFYLRQSIRLLLNPPIQLRGMRISSVYQSKALLPTGAPESWNQDFLNMVVCGESDLAPHELLVELKKIERSLGRQDLKKWAPREIDLDILAIDQRKLQSSELTIPHQEITNRNFVLQPFSELLPDWRLPTQGNKTLQELWDQKKSASGFVEDCRKVAGPLLPVEIVGIINVTPDSFSDGNLNLNPNASLESAMHLSSAGASVLDYGAESTRPDAKPVSEEEEWERLLPALELVLQQRRSGGLGISSKISVDTRKSRIAKEALKLGIDWINDVRALTDPEMVSVLRETDVDIVAMHHLHVPPMKDEILSLDRDATEQILEWGNQRIRSLETSGIPRARIIFDPGIGFGKTPDQTFSILRNIHRLKELGTRLLVGHSRKSFLRVFGETSAAKRDPESEVISAFISLKDVDYIRVHDVARNHRAIQAALAIA